MRCQVALIHVHGASAEAVQHAVFCTAHLYLLAVGVQVGPLLKGGAEALEAEDDGPNSCICACQAKL